MVTAVLQKRPSTTAASSGGAAAAIKGRRACRRQLKKQKIIKQRPSTSSSDRQKTWLIKLKFLKRFGTQLIEEQLNDNISGNTSLFCGGLCSSSSRKTYAQIHQTVWDNLNEQEKSEFGDFKEAAAFRSFANNTKFLFSPSNKAREANFKKKRWLYDELLNLGFSFLPSSYLMNEGGRANKTDFSKE